MAVPDDEKNDSEAFDSVLRHIARTTSPPVPGGSVAGRFRIEGVAGRGGFGAVYRAYDDETGRVIALKVLKDDSMDLARFAREAELLATICHPNVVAYVAHGLTEEGAPYLAMDWLDGLDLAQRLRRGPLSIEESLTVVVRAAQGLAAAHALGIVHRDIKPSNLYLVGGSAGDVRVIDFGVARAPSSESALASLTSTGVRVGTPAYMAPEQALGARDLSPRVDVFSLGCVLFECIVGEPPLAGANPQALLSRLLAGQVPRLSERRPDAPAVLDALLEGMLARDPIDRFSDGGAVAMAVASVLRDSTRVPSGIAGPVVTSRAAWTQTVLVVSAAGRSLSARIAEVLGDFGGEILGRAEPESGVMAPRARSSAIVAFVADSPAEAVHRAARCAIALRAADDSLRMAITTSRRDLVIAAASAISDHAGAPLGDVADGDIVVDGTTERHLGGEFDLRRRGSVVVLSGKADPALESARGLVGRTRETASLEGVYREVLDEKCARAVFVLGEAGIGKTRLVAELLRRLRRDDADVTVLRAFGDRPTSTSPFAMVAQLLSSDERAGWATLSGADADFLRELTGHAPVDGEPAHIRAARRDPLLMADAFRNAWLAFVERMLASRPLVLVLDDVHHADVSSLRLLDAALGQFAERSLLFVGTARADDARAAIATFAARSPEEIVLKPLRPAIAAELVRAVVGDAPPAEVERIVERGAGNPLRLLEVVRLGAADALPGAAASVAEARLANLDTLVQRVLRAGSLFGTRFPREGLATLLVGGSTSATGIDQALAVARDQRFVVLEAKAHETTGEQWAFSHGLMQEVAYATLDERDRRAGHGAVGRWLAAQPGANPSLVAWHFERASEPEGALRWYEAGARAALRGRDLERVLALSDNAMACGPQDEDLARIALLRAEAALAKGDPAEGKRAASLAFDSARAGSVVWTEAAGILVTALGQRGDNAEVARLAERVRAHAPDGEAAPAWAICLCRAATQLFSAGERSVCQGLVDAAEQVVGQDPIARAWLERWLAAKGVVNHDYDRAISHQGEAAVLHAAAGDVRGAALCRVLLASMHVFAVDFERAEEELALAIPMARRTGADYYVRWATYARGKILALSHEPSVAREHLARVRQELAGNPRIVAGTHVYGALAAFRARDVAWAESESRAALAAHDAPAIRGVALAALSRALVLRGAASDALRCAEDALEILRRLGTIEENEALVHLAAIEAPLACGFEERAREAARGALDRLGAISRKLSTPARAERYLHAHDVHAETVRRGLELGLSAGAP